MPSAAALCNFHEQRLNDLDAEVSGMRREQGEIDAKLDALTSHVQELKSEMSEKLDKVLDKVNGLSTLESRLAVLEKAGESTKKIALKVIPPLGMILLGLVAGAGGSTVMKFILGIFGG